VPPEVPLGVGAAFIAYPRGMEGAGAAGDSAWVAATLFRDRKMLGSVVLQGQAGAGYVPGLLALREGRIVEDALRALWHETAEDPHDVALVNATGRDHPRRAGLALHVGAVVDIPTVGVTDRPLLATGADPEPSRGAASPLMIDGEVVGYLVRTNPRARPLAVHAAWRTSPDVAREVVMKMAWRSRTPEPLRQARRLARTARGREGEGR